jgi:hypothetical protein
VIIWGLFFPCFLDLSVISSLHGDSGLGRGNTLGLGSDTFTAGVAGDAKIQGFARVDSCIAEALDPAIFANSGSFIRRMTGAPI